MHTRTYVRPTIERLEDRCAPTGAALAAFQPIAPQIVQATQAAAAFLQTELGAYIAQQTQIATTLGPRGIAAAIIPLEQLTALYVVLPQVGLDTGNNIVGLMESQLSQMP